MFLHLPNYTKIFSFVTTQAAHFGKGLHILSKMKNDHDPTLIFATIERTPVLTW